MQTMHLIRWYTRPNGREVSARETVAVTIADTSMPNRNTAALPHGTVCDCESLLMVAVEDSADGESQIRAAVATDYRFAALRQYLAAPVAPADPAEAPAVKPARARKR